MRYATIPTWADHLRGKEGVEINPSTVYRRLRKVEIIGLSGRNKIGKLFKNSYYSEADIRRICPNEFKKIPQANEKNFIEISGVSYATINTWFKHIRETSEASITAATIKARFKKTGLEGIDGIDISGVLREKRFFSWKQIVSACKDLIEPYPVVNKNGFAEVNGVRHASLSSWRKMLRGKGILSIAMEYLKKELELNGKKGITARSSIGRVYEKSYYSEGDVFEVVKKFHAIPKINKDGFCCLDGKKYGPVNSWAKVLNLSHRTISDSLSKHQKKGIKGRTVGSKIFTFYAESDVLDACRDHLIELPHANEDGFFEKDGIRYGFLNAWIKELSLTSDVIKPRLEKANKRGIEGRVKNSIRRIFYSEPDVRSVCADLLQNLPQADESGFFEKNGEIWGFAFAWSNKLSISSASITRRLLRVNPPSVEGRDRGGRITDFYSESDVRSACLDLIRSQSQADESGFFEKDDIRYGSVEAWSRVLPISVNAIKCRLERSKIHSIPGKTCKGRKAVFYPEPDVRSACADILHTRRSAS